MGIKRIGDEMAKISFLLRHGSQSQNQDIIETKKKEYVDSFTIRGLTRSIRGKTIESVFWSTMLLIGVISSSLVIYRLITKFRRRAVYTEIRFQLTDRNYFPSVTFCERQLLVDSFFAYCGVPSRLTKMKFLDPTLPCAFYNKSKKANVVSDGHNYWATEIFNVTKCDTWSGTQCNNNNYMKVLERVNNSCITWNYRGDFYDICNHVDIEFQFNNPSHLTNKAQIFAIVHDHEIEEIEITRKIDIGPHTYYEVKIDKTIIKRLPSPFPGNCSNGKDGDIFPGKYSRYACIESQHYINIYKTCGDIFDYMRSHIPPEIKQKYKKNVTIIEFLRCVGKLTSRDINSFSNCRFPCEDVELNIVSYIHVHNTTNDGHYRFSIQFQRFDTYKIMEEKELYTWYQMACEIGGFIGLVMGMSIISLVEIFTYICLSIAKKVQE